MNAVVFGAKGQLGTELVRLLGDEAAVREEELSILNAAGVEALLRHRRPDVVINCAAYNAVDRAETERATANAVNAEGPRIVAAACKRHGASLVHYSTNFVFDGALDRPYLETDQPAPLSVYGRSKLLGERMVTEAGGNSLVIRTAALFGGPVSFPRRILERARSVASLPVVSDQRVNPTYAFDLAEATLDLVRRGTTGIVHVVAEGCCGWDEFAREVLKQFGVDTRVESVPSDAYPTPARRPTNGCLGSSRYPLLRPWREALHDFATHAPPHL